MSASFLTSSELLTDSVKGAARIDLGIRYPSYKSFDQFIDVQQLRLLDSYLEEKLLHHAKSRASDYFVNAHRLDLDQPYKPGVREVWLSRTKSGVPYNYLDLDRPELWQRTADADDFAVLMDFIETLPFAAFGRMLIIYDDSGAAVPAHRDHLDTSICNEFVWLRTNLKKQFYVLSEKSGEKIYVDSYSAWFDSVNQYHGSDAGTGLTFSIRIDGKFSEAFRSQIPVPAVNRASTPALWASVGKAK